MTSFDVYIDSYGEQVTFSAEDGELRVRLPQPLYINSDNWECALTFLSFAPNDILNLPNQYWARYRGKTAHWAAQHISNEDNLLHTITSKLPRGLSFSTDHTNGFLIANIKQKKDSTLAPRKLRVSPDLGKVLGFPILSIGSGQMSSGMNVAALVPYVSVQCDFVANTIVSGEYIKALKSIPLTNLITKGGHSYYEKYFPDPNYVRVQQGELATLKITFVTKDDRPVHFKMKSQIALTLRFKKLDI